MCVQGFDTIDLPANVAQTGVHVLLPVSEEEEPLEYANLIDDSQAAINHYNNENVCWCMCLNLFSILIYFIDFFSWFCGLFNFSLVYFLGNKF